MPARLPRPRQDRPLLIRLAQSLVLTVLMAAICFLVLAPRTALDPSSVAAATVGATSTASPPAAATVRATSTASPSAAVGGQALLPPPVPNTEPAAQPLTAPDASAPADASPPTSVEGRIVEASTGKPLPGASVWVGGQETVTDGDGRFAVSGLDADRRAIVKLPGYARRHMVLDRSPLTVTLTRQTIKAAYLTYYGVGDRGIRERVLGLVDRTELNAVVIDVKGDRGLIPYRTSVPEALAAGAQGPVIIKDFDGLIADLKARGIYTIARIVVFKDSVLAHHRPDLAIIDTRTGRPWVDNEKLAWVDPTRPEVWAYVTAVAREAAAKGFDEVQFDYVRFPTDGRLSAARYSRPNTQTVRLETIAGFLAEARRQLGPTGVFMAADVFGYTAFNENDTDIGQRIEELAPHVDYLCPMVYPSGYHRGIPGVRKPVENPYDIVRESVRLIRKRSVPSVVQVRPWLQDFRDYAFDRRPFGPREVQAQMRGADDAGAVGWMLWNPRNDYTADALRAAPMLARRGD